MVFQTPVVKEENVKVWLDSKDEMMIQLANSCLGKPMPIEEELTEILTFFNIFSLGLIEMGLKDMSKVYERRIRLFIIGLKQLGFSSIDRREYMARRTIKGPFNRIIRRACGKAAYVMVELKRYLQV
jgi:hypothetical protein